MFINIIIWTILFAIAVSDAQKHRIPNKAVLGLLLAVSVSLLLIPTTNIWEHIYGGVVTFSVCFVLYMTKIMAGGDVKLLAVIGVWLGLDHLWQACGFIILAGGIVSVFYVALYVSLSGHQFTEQVKCYCFTKVSAMPKLDNSISIPFAPIVVLGLAYFFYIQ
ncbi:prepilin peptidase [Vibrio azureus]|nr:A24 family peptidase [Vibrio azureus]AUI86831.1 prepilin peptidase [Vibrio azureus]